MKKDFCYGTKGMLILETGIHKVLQMDKIINQVIKEVKKGESLTDVVYEITGQMLNKKMSPPKEQQYDKAYFELLRKQVYPIGFGKRFRPLFYSRSIIQKLTKKKLSQQAFGSEKLGMIIIRPEAFPFTKEANEFLSELGCTVLLSKLVFMSQHQIYSIYSHEMAKWQDFPIVVGILMSGPSRVLVFKHTSQEVYIETLKKTDPKRYRQLKTELYSMALQDLFHTTVKGLRNEGKHGTLRGKIMQKLKENGFDSMTGKSRLLDSTGYLKYRVKTGKPIYNIITGIHAPSNQKELLEHGEVFLTRKELKKLIQ